QTRLHNDEEVLISTVPTRNRRGWQLAAGSFVFLSYSVEPFRSKSNLFKEV
ncbi:hypothetical protein CISIN_1g038427mg, partial [Citrus sinensis]